jgi:hypothetical protein
VWTLFYLDEILAHTAWCLAPAFGKLTAPISPESDEKHLCFASHIFGPFLTSESNPSADPPTFFPSCPVEIVDSETEHSPTLSIACTSTAARPQAVTSRHSAPHLISETPADPLSLPSPITVRDSPSPPPTDQGQAQEELADFDSMVDLAIIDGYPDFTTWNQALLSRLAAGEDKHMFSVRAPNLDRAVQGLHTFLRAQSAGGELLWDEQMDLQISINPKLSLEGLFYAADVNFMV